MFGEVELPSLKQATKEEWKQARIDYARKNYKIGDKFKCLKSGIVAEITQLDTWTVDDNNNLWCIDINQNTNINMRHALIFKDGKWAKPVKETTLTYQQIADKFKVDVNTLKIKK